MGLFQSSLRYNPDTDVPDLTGKVALVTGGNAGIGYETVKVLVQHGAKVYIGARNESRATGAIAKLKAEGALDGTGAGQVEWLPLDLATPSTTRAGAQELLRRETRLDMLINNAGMVTGDAMRKLDAKIPIIAMMSTNHLGPFVLTNTLLPLLKSTAELPNSDVRIIVVSSRSYDKSYAMDWSSYNGWDFPGTSFLNAFRAYATSKMANILFAKELQRRLDEEGLSVIAMSLHPGDIATDNAMNTFRTGLGILGRLLTLHYQPPYTGAYNSVFAATSPIVRERRNDFAGAYLIPVGVMKTPGGDASNATAARDLWETSERAVADM